MRWDEEGIHRELKKKKKELPNVYLLLSNLETNLLLVTESLQ